MEVTLVGRDFDFSGNDGISRYSYEIYTELIKKQNKKFKVTAQNVLDVSLLKRALSKLQIDSGEIAHLMYPNPISVAKKNAVMITTWHDNRVFSRADNVQFLSAKYYREKSVKELSISNYKESDAIISVSSKTERELNWYLKKNDLFDIQKRFFVINEGIDSKFLAQKIWKGERKDFGYVGSIHQTHKNLHDLLMVFGDIARESKQSKLHIFTMSPDAKKILFNTMKEFRSLSASNVVLHEKASDAEMLRYLPKLVAYLHLSKEEGFGLPIMEALAVGTRPLILRVADIPDEVTKYAYKADIDGITKEALNLVESQKPAPEIAIKYARSFTWEKAASKTLEVYESMSS